MISQYEEMHKNAESYMSKSKYAFQNKIQSMSLDELHKYAENIRRKGRALRDEGLSSESEEIQNLHKKWKAVKKEILFREFLK